VKAKSSVKNKSLVKNLAFFAHAIETLLPISFSTSSERRKCTVSLLLLCVKELVPR